MSSQEASQMSDEAKQTGTVFSRDCAAIQVIEDLPPSSKLVIKILEFSDEPLCAGEIAKESRLSPRTCRHALKCIKETSVDILEQKVDLNDARKNIYTIKDD
jgi:AraC-like DNA-binding protein